MSNNAVHSSCNCIDNYTQRMSDLFHEQTQLPFIMNPDGVTKQIVIISENSEPKKIIGTYCPFCGNKYGLCQPEEENYGLENKITPSDEL